MKYYIYNVYNRNERKIGIEILYLFFFWETEAIKISLLSKTNKDRNELIRQNIDKFEIKYLKELEKEYDNIIKEAQEENKEERNYFKKEEKSFINDLIKYKKNYLLWAYKFYIPSTNFIFHLQITIQKGT